MKLLLDFAPLAVFFVVYKTYGLMAATGALMAATLVSIAITYAQTRKLSPAPVITAVIIGIFGTLTLWLNNEQFIKLKPTIVNLIFASILLIGYMRGKYLLHYVLDSAMTLQQEGWKKLTLRWGCFFLFLAALNEFIWRNFPTEFWVDFKVFGMLTCTMAFSLAQIPLVKKYWVEEETKD